MTAALDLIAWLDRAKEPTGGGIRERYKLSTQTWSNVIRPDCNAESVYAYLLAWQATGDASYLTKSRNAWNAYKGFQDPNGSWIFGSYNSQIWVNDNSEVTIFLLRAAELDTTNAATYRAAALSTTGYLLSIRDADSGMWPTSTYAGYKAPWSTAHAVSALTVTYPLAGENQPAHLTAIEAGLAAITSLIRPDGRVQAAVEAPRSNGEESWRPPSSDQSICVRAFALAERQFPNHASVAAWRAARRTLLGWLSPLIHSSGAIRNGDGVGVNHADVAHITDHVYTTAFAIEAYRLSAEVDNSAAYLAKADAIAAFAAGNVYYSGTDPDANGCLRGAYDLVAQDFNTSEVSQNASEEGGGDMAYSGWSAAPVAALLFEDPPTINARRRRGSAAAFL